MVRLNARNIEQINEALRNSFAAIKQDMLDLKSSINVQAHDLRELKQNQEALRGEFVTADKLNLVKIRIGELNESLKRIWGIEEQIKALEDKIVSKAFVNQQVDGVAIKVNDIKGKLESFTKSYVSEMQIKKLLEDLNKELNSLRSNIEEVKTIKDTISQRTMEKVAFKLNSKIEDVRSQFGALSSDVKSSIEELRKAHQNLVSENQINDLLNDINEEFDKVKEVLYQNNNAIEQLRENAASSEKSIKSSFKRDIEQMNSRLLLLQNDMGEARRVQNAPVYSAPAKKSAKGKKETPQIEIKQVPVKRPARKIKFFANLLISVAFVSFILSITAFVVDNPSFSDNLAVVAVVTFAAGILLRFMVYMRKRGYDQD